MSDLKKQIFTHIRENLGIDDSELMEELFREYCATFHNSVDRLSQGLEQQDRDGLHRAAHALKGCSGNVGHDNVHKLCLSLEEAARLGNFPTARELLCQLQTAGAELDSES